MNLQEALESELTPELFRYVENLRGNGSRDCCFYQAADGEHVYQDDWSALAVELWCELPHAIEWFEVEDNP